MRAVPDMRGATASLVFIGFNVQPFLITMLALRKEGILKPVLLLDYSDFARDRYFLFQD
jgi:hypothetical protein